MIRQGKYKQGKAVNCSKGRDVSASGHNRTPVWVGFYRSVGSVDAGFNMTKKAYKPM